MYDSYLNEDLINSDSIQQKRYTYQRLVQALDACEAGCIRTAAYVGSLKQQGLRSRQGSLLRECEDICNLTLKMLHRKSPYSKQTIQLCARICRDCAEECAKFSDQVSRQCSEVCMNAYRECMGYTSP